ncbi:transposase, Ptta/En/Spm [Tanacetum coccineum]
MDRSWMYTAPRASKRYTNGVEYFLDFAFEKSSQNGTILCSCIDCQSLLFAKRAVVYDHLIRSGFKRGYLYWKDHGEVHEAAPLGNRREDEGIYQHDMHGLLDDLFPTLPMEGNNADTSEGEENTRNTKISSKENIGHVGYLSLSLKRFIASNLVKGPERRGSVRCTGKFLVRNDKRSHDPQVPLLKAQIKYLRQGFMMFAAAVQEQVPNLNLSSVMNFMNMEVDDLSSIHDNMTGKNPSSASDVIGSDGFGMSDFFLVWPLPAVAYLHLADGFVSLCWVGLVHS